MIKGIFNAGRNLQALSKNIDIVANNIANVNTTGYKREVPFSEIMSQIADTPVKQITDFSEGNLIETSNPLDLAIRGDAFFLVKTDNGTEYTKGGKFTISEDGFIETDDGARVLGMKGEINVYEGVLDKNQDINISKNGDVKVGDIIIDKLAIAKIGQNQRVIRQDSSNFIPTDGMVIFANDNEYSVDQGYLEESNVNPVLEMQSMITISKEFESTQKTIRYLDQSLEKLNEVGKV